MQLIGLVGPAGAGKDSVADVLCRDHGFVRYEFARPIKAMLAAIGVDAYDRSIKESPHPIFGVSPRRMAQTLGTEWGRTWVDPDIWLLLAAQFLYSHDRPDGKVVITDCRFKNEAAFIAGRGGDIWHVDRPGVAPVERHSSEDGLERLPGDIVIPNHKSLAALSLTVGAAIAVPTQFWVPYDGETT